MAQSFASTAAKQETFWVENFPSMYQMTTRIVHLQNNLTPEKSSRKFPLDSIPKNCPFGAGVVV